MILVDTSVWIDHLRRTSRELVSLLETDQVLVHPFVIGELACGNLRNRGTILELLSALPQPLKTTDQETLFFIEERSLHGHGLGLIDIHLLASTVILGTAQLWTLDSRLHAAAKRLGVSYTPA
jgi:predicted nucleic acid-binding protein